MFRFANHGYVYLLWFIPLLTLLLYVALKKKKKLLRSLGDIEVIARLNRSTSFKRQLAKGLIVLSSITLLIIALMGPQMGTVLSEVKREGIDIIVILDVSKSMQAEDISPNRLERAKFEISRFIERLNGDRIGLVAFAVLKTPARSKWIPPLRPSRIPSRYARVASLYFFCSSNVFPRQRCSQAFFESNRIASWSASTARSGSPSFL